MTGRVVRAATAPARWAAMPAAQMKTLQPEASCSRTIVSVLSGVRWAEETVMKKPMPSFFRISAQGATFSSSDFDPMIMQTEAMDTSYLPSRWRIPFMPISVRWKLFGMVMRFTAL